jgi:hypothetical protein
MAAGTFVAVNILWINGEVLQGAYVACIRQIAAEYPAEYELELTSDAPETYERMWVIAPVVHRVRINTVNGETREFVDCSMTVGGSPPRIVVRGHMLA